MDTFEIMNQHYSGYDESARLLSRHGQVEYLTTMRYIEKYLKPGMKILEIGAGTGRYSHTLARMGYDVTAVDLVPHNLEILRADTEPGEKLAVYQGNATDLSLFSAGTFDMTLLLGPMYHLFVEADKLAALGEAIRVTRDGGVLFAAYCMNEATVYQYGFVKGNIYSELEMQHIDPVTFRCKSVPELIFELYRREDIDALMSHFAVTRLHYVASDLMTNHMRDVIDAMDDKTFTRYLDYHFYVCERPDMVGITHHSLDIFRKD